MEIILIVLVVLSIFIGLKLFLWLLKAGIFLVVLPVKTLLGLILGGVFFVVIPVILLPVLFGAVLAVLPFLLVGIGIFLLVRYAV
jgi:hypothetical protein